MAKLEKPQSARRKPADAADEVETFTGEVPKASVVKAVAEKYGTLKAQMDTKRGEIGALIKAAEEEKNIHRGAFRKACAYAKMDQAKFEDEWRHLTSYLLAMGKIPQGDLFKDAGDESPAEKATFAGRK